MYFYLSINTPLDLVDHTVAFDNVRGSELLRVLALPSISDIQANF